VAVSSAVSIAAASSAHSQVPVFLVAFMHLSPI